MSNIQWCGYEWLTHERWGEIHPEKTFVHYDESAVSINENGWLVLKTHKNPKYFKELDVTSQFGIGLVSNTTEFGYGYFEIEAKLPKGKNLWPAFWMWSFQSWPPEIDVFEGYTRNNKGYFKLRLKNLLGFWNVQTNIHRKGLSSLGAKTHWFGLKNPANNFIKYGCLWEEDKIEIYYNDRLVRKITDKETIENFKGHTMNIIINNSVDYDMNLEDDTNSEFIIKYFKYEKR